MSNIIIGWPNRADSATVAGGSWTSLSNIRTREANQLARSTDATTGSTQFTIDLGSTDFSIKAISLHNHNLSSTATWRVTVGTSSGAADIYDSGFVSVWSIAFDSDLGEFGETAYWSEMTGQSGVKSAFSVFNTFADTPRSNQYFTVYINDIGNSEGYVEVGRLGIWSGLQTTLNATYGATHSYDDFSETSFSLSGELIYNKRRSRRLADISYDALTDTEASIVYEMIRRSGVTGEVCYIPDPADLAYCQRFGFRGRMRRLGNLEKNSYNTSVVEYRFEELL